MRPIVASCLAPFLLLRTEESTRRGLKAFRKGYNYFDTTSTEFKIFFNSIGDLPFLLHVLGGGGVVAGGVVGGGSLFCKVWSTLATCITSRWQCLKAIPHNWYRIVFCVDMCYPPELMPGIEEKKYKELTADLNEFRFVEWISEIKSTNMFFTSTAIIAAIFLYLPALAYRWSLKSSSLVWFPLTWLIGGEEKREPGVDENTWMKFRLKQECKTAFAFIKFAYSPIVVFFFTALPLYIVGNHEKIVGAAQRLGIIENPFFQYFFLLDYHNFKVWHITRSFAAILTFTIFIYANKLLVAREDIPGYGQESASTILNALGRLRTIFALITIFCGFYLLFDPIFGLTSFITFTVERGMGVFS